MSLFEQYPALMAALAAAVAAVAAALIVSGRVRGAMARAEQYQRGRQQSLIESIDRAIEMTGDATDSAEARIQALSDRLNARIDEMNRISQSKLDEMRSTVDERLRSTLDSRLGESFRVVNAQLEGVNRGLGEMQALASGVGDLKKVLQGVKTRGEWGEVQLGALLAEMLAPGQYEANAQVSPGSRERVEYAVRLPGAAGSAVLIPIDSKLPLEPFRQLVAASESGDRAAIDAAELEFKRAVTRQAREISQKYIHPPETTDFALLFLPVESLYAEALRIPGLNEGIRQSHRVSLAGPSTLAALLTSLQMGFRTVAIEQRSGELMALLHSVKLEFDRFGATLDKTRQRLDQASDELNSVADKTRKISRKLDELERLE
ncbi:MAG: DNA recombination protein RmuC [Clostridiales bacterium]|nr:DNA recombination protein RmuC [Clostridiales bacterium]